jgi:hypothetical protein
MSAAYVPLQNAAFALEMHSRFDARLGPDHPLSLGFGELRIRTGGQEESFAIAGGFLQVRPDKVVVMAETADLASEIDLEAQQPDAAARTQPRADLRFAVLVGRADARGEAMRVEGQAQVADVRHQQLGGELVEPLGGLAGRRHHAACAVEQHDARAAHQRGGAGRLGHHGAAQAGRDARRGALEPGLLVWKRLARFSWACPKPRRPRGARRTRAVARRRAVLLEARRAIGDRRSCQVSTAPAAGDAESR